MTTINSKEIVLRELRKHGDITLTRLLSKMNSVSENNLRQTISSLRLDGYKIKCLPKDPERPESIYKLVGEVDYYVLDNIMKLLRRGEHISTLDIANAVGIDIDEAEKITRQAARLLDFKVKRKKISTWQLVT